MNGLKERLMVVYVTKEVPSLAQVDLFLPKCPWVIIDGIVEGGPVSSVACLDGVMFPGSQGSEEMWVLFTFVDNS